MRIYIAFVLYNYDGDDFYVDEVSVSPSNPVAGVVPSEIEFGQVRFGTTPTESVFVTNVVTELLTISSVDALAVSAPGNAAYQVDLSTFDTTLEPGKISSPIATFIPNDTL